MDNGGDNNLTLHKKYIMSIINLIIHLVIPDGQVKIASC